MRYEGRVFRPPSEADAFILQATIGCSWNKCTYCDMYRDKSFRVRDLDACLEDIAQAGAALAGGAMAHPGAPPLGKVFVADGDALTMDLDHWLPILAACRDRFPQLRRVSCYAMASNILDKTDAELRSLRKAGLTRFYIGPESGDDETLKRIAKGSTAAEHVEAARRAKAAGIQLSVIFLLGAGGTARSQEHARASAELATAMDPEFVSALTLTVLDGTPMARAEAKGHFELPEVRALLEELRTFVAHARPTRAIFRTNHASNHLALGGRLPADSPRLVAAIDEVLTSGDGLRPEWARGL